MKKILMLLAIVMTVLSGTVAYAAVIPTEVELNKNLIIN